jgi:3-phenylpropionate/trans-cinnamate dioxygenase ferredoxin reductase component
MMHFKYAIIGGGVTAGYAAQVFADAGQASEVTAIFSQENIPPYDRPPLSKSYLAGKKPADEVLINEPDFYVENKIKLFLNTRITRVDLQERKLFSDDESFGFEKLLIATGSQPRTFQLPGADLAGIYYLRRLSDARQIRSEIEEAENGDKAVVIGGSFIGMEVASILAQKGLETTLVFPESRVWEAFFTPAMSQFFSTYYQERGVTILPGIEIEEFAGENGRVAAVHLKGGEQLPADFVVAGIGVKPNVTLFANTPLKINEGILVNRFLETNMPGVYAAGDVAEYRDVLFDQTRRVEHWDNAYRQGQHAARGMLGKQTVYDEVPYFFSDVFDLSYEFWGDPAPADDVVHRGDVENGRFSVWWLKDNKLQAAFVMNRPAEEREAAPKWIQSGAEINTTRLSDEQQPLQSAAKT